MIKKIFTKLIAMTHVPKKIAYVMAISFTCILILPTIFWGVYSYQRIVKNMYEEQRITTEYIINGIDRNLKIYFREIQKITDNIFGAEIIQNPLTQSGKNVRGELSIKDVQAMNTFFHDLLGGRADIVRIVLLSDRGEIYSYSSTTLDDLYPADDRIISEIAASNGRFTICNSRYQKYSNGKRYYVVTVGRQIRNLDSGKAIGYLIIDIDYDSLKKIVGLNSKNSKDILFINQPNGNVVYSSLSNSDVLEKYSSTSSYINAMQNNCSEIVFTSNYFNWQYNILRSNQLIFNSLRSSAIQQFLICISIIILIFIASLIISYSLTKPIHKLEEAMTSAEAEHYKKKIHVFTTYYELIQLLNCYNKMIAEIQQLLERQQQLYKKQAEAEYQALQMQITPHFLYNSLESINCLAQIKNEPEISAMVRGLAHIFQYNMKFDSGKVTLIDEVEHVKNYCMLQAINYQDSFTISYNIPSNMMNRHVIKFMLQPLVENSISHGMKQTKRGGKIEVEAEDKDGFMVITVKDNGSGMTEEEEKLLRHELSASAANGERNVNISSHIGLNNVNRRLKYYYGSRAEISFETTDNKGTAVHICIPLDLAQEEEKDV